MKKTFYNYLYLKSSKMIKGEEYFGVIKVKVFNNDRFTAELKARTYAKKHKLGELAGGCFTENYLPHDFKTNYTVYNCPDNTKISKLTKKDKYIIGLIEYESNMKYIIF